MGLSQISSKYARYIAASAKTVTTIHHLRDAAWKSACSTVRCLSTTGTNNNNSTTSTDTTLTDLQRSQWNSYVATGRGSASLFQAVDKDSDGKVHAADVHAFFHAVSGVYPRALLALSETKEMTMQDFQRWLIDATQEHGYNKFQTHYDNHPLIGNKADHDTSKVEYHWNESTMNQAVRRMQYAVRGQVVIAAEKLASQGREIMYFNIGNPHGVQQRPITFYRQVLALCDLPAEHGVDHIDAGRMFPADVIQRAREMRDIVGPSGTGAYTHSQGLFGVREHVAEFISKRDGHAAYPGDIFLTNGASSGIESILQCLISNDHDAIMIPIPQYPIYSALIAKLGGRQIGYELDEERNWSITREELQKRLDAATKEGLTVKGLAMINPGNPTGQVLQRKDVETICKFCAENGIVLLSDEVYQRNVYADNREFLSAKKVAVETPGCENIELASFHSTSKGLMGECGRRGGYMELHHINPYVQSQIYKLASSGLCSCVAGQLMTCLMVKGPEEGSESYAKFVEEEQSIFNSLKKRAKALVDGLNSIDGISCEPAEGAMYAFPKIKLPQKAIDQAKQDKQSIDTLYALSLLEETGICVVPASGFGQKADRIGFRTTFLPPEEKLFHAISEFGRHHRLFCEKYP